MITHAVLQKLPPEALGDDDRHGVVEVLTVGSREEMERFLAGPPTALAAGNERKLATSRLRGTSGNCAANTSRAGFPDFAQEHCFVSRSRQAQFEAADACKQSRDFH
jgi:hypothetical protein